VRLNCQIRETTQALLENLDGPTSNHNICDALGADSERNPCGVLDDFYSARSNLDCRCGLSPLAKRKKGATKVKRQK
jgi:hypothetical protein